MLYGPKSTQRRARELRRTMSLPEVLLWQELRKRPEGLRFRRQHPAGPYVVDFFCPARKLAIEVDGEAHGYGDRPVRDRVRDDWLLGEGIKVDPYSCPGGVAGCGVGYSSYSCSSFIMPWKGRRYDIDGGGVFGSALHSFYPSVSPAGRHLPFQGRITTPFPKSHPSDRGWRLARLGCAPKFLETPHARRSAAIYRSH